LGKPRLKINIDKKKWIDFLKKNRINILDSYNERHCKEKNKIILQNSNSPTKKNICSVWEKKVGKVVKTEKLQFGSKYAQCVPGFEDQIIKSIF
jgi:hypothetical protein